MTDLAATLDDLVWEQALESALRRRLVTVADLKHPVLDRRPAGAPPTESLLETLFVQARPILPDAVRQLWIEDAHARLDLAWPQVGLFVELDGQHHKDQPVYDARRETAAVAATGWLCGRFTWTEVVRIPTTTARRLAAISWRAAARPPGRPGRATAARSAGGRTT